MRTLLGCCGGSDRSAEQDGEYTRIVNSVPYYQRAQSSADTFDGAVSSVHNEVREGAGESSTSAAISRLPPAGTEQVDGHRGFHYGRLLWEIWTGGAQEMPATTGVEAAADATTGSEAAADATTGSEAAVDGAHNQNMGEASVTRSSDYQSLNRHSRDRNTYLFLGAAESVAGSDAYEDMRAQAVPESEYEQYLDPSSLHVYEIDAAAGAHGDEAVYEELDFSVVHRRHPDEVDGRPPLPPRNVPSLQRHQPAQTEGAEDDEIYDDIGG